MWKRLHVKYSLFVSSFNESWILSTDSRKNSNIKFHQNLSNGSLVPRGRTHGRTDGHDKAVSRFSRFCERAWDGRTRRHDCLPPPLLALTALRIKQRKNLNNNRNARPFVQFRSVPGFRFGSIAKILLCVVCPDIRKSIVSFIGF